MEQSKAELKKALDQEINRRLAWMDFWEYCLYMDVEFFCDRPFLKEVAAAMMWLYTEYSEGRPRRISVSMPPRAGKSYITSLFCSWWLGKLPMLSVMRNSCTHDLYVKFSYDVRKIVRGEKFKEVFPEAVLSPDKQNVMKWNLVTSKQVAYFGNGVGGNIIGFGANLAINDDLYPGIEEALSENYNESVHRWKEGDHDSRKELNCPEIYIGTRWRKDDVIGRAIERGRIHKQIKISAMFIDENGDLHSFCENVKTTEEYLEIKHDIDESIWEAEYQQEPIESKGLMFAKDQLKFVDMSAVNWKRTEYKFLFVDPADTGGDDLSAPHCYLIDDRIYVRRVIYNQEGTDVNEPAITELLIDTATNACDIEGNSAWYLLGNAIRAAVNAEFDDCDIRIIKNTTNKNTRILAEAAFIKNHFYFDINYEKNKQYNAFMKNLTSYLKTGGNKHEDAPDSAAGAAKHFKIKFPTLFRRKTDSTEK
jgi:predicted phage terminase large subunit-like protein